MNIIEKLKLNNRTVSTAESVTGGQIASEICRISGASKHFVGGIVSYTKQAKCELLGLAMTQIEKYGVYSVQTAEAMAIAVRQKTKSDVSVATTGVAGPQEDEGTKAGTVYFGFAVGDKVISERKVFRGRRNRVRKRAAAYAINRLCELLN